MGTANRTAMGTIVFGLVAMLLSCPSVTGAEEEQAEPKRSDQLLLEIMDMHAVLASNEVFIAQAGVFAAYLETARGSDEAMKIEIYTRVQRLLAKLKPATASVSEAAEPATPDVEAKPPAIRPDEAKTTYVPGGALLEVFKTDSIDNLPPIPITRAHWKRDLACSEGYVLPLQINEIGEGSPYVAKFVFYYEAKQPGMYGFTITHLARSNGFRLTVGNVLIARSAERGNSFFGSNGANLEGLGRGRVMQAVASPTNDLPIRKSS